MKFTTLSGSVYEVDPDKPRIRRLSGTADPTPRQGKDREWQSYDDMTLPKIGLPVVILWSAADGTTTITSMVTGVEEPDAGIAVAEPRLQENQRAGGGDPLDGSDAGGHPGEPAAREERQRGAEGMLDPGSAPAVDNGDEGS